MVAKARRYQFSATRKCFVLLLLFFERKKKKTGYVRSCAGYLIEYKTRLLITGCIPTADVKLNPCSIGLQ